MNRKNCVIAVYKTHLEAEEAVKILQKSRVNMKQCSIVGQGFHSEEEVVGFYNADDRMMLWGKQGAFWGGVWGLLVGSGFFWIPGIGTILAGGALVSSIVGALEGAAVVGGLNILGASLYSIGIPKNSIVKYEMEIKANKFVIVFHGTEEETERAKDVLNLTPRETLEVASENEAANA